MASSEIYATWPRSTIVANVLAIMSFTLNRVYTEWYRNQGYDFTITSSTAFDHKWIYGRDIFEPIQRWWTTFLTTICPAPVCGSRILTQYCDGRRVSCPGWMTQWGSCSLGEQGYSAIEILRRFYGNSIYINTAEQISGILISYPGNRLRWGPAAIRCSCSSNLTRWQLCIQRSRGLRRTDLRTRNGGVRTGVSVGVWTSADGRGRFCYLVQDFSYLCRGSRGLRS